jgi:cyanate lyase
MNRLDVTEKIISTKVSKGIKWEDVAKKVGLSKEWTTAACLGQMTLDASPQIQGLGAKNKCSEIFRALVYGDPNKYRTTSTSKFYELFFNCFVRLIDVSNLGSI